MKLLAVNPEQYQDWRVWARQLLQQLLAPNLTEPLKLPEFPVSRLPTPSQDGLLVFGLDELTTPQPLYSYNGAWYKFDGTTPQTDYVFNIPAKRVQVRCGTLTLEV